MSISQKDGRRFLGYVGRGNNGCQEWLGARTDSGYGQFWYKGKNFPAHRFAYYLSHGRLPRRSVVMHICDNPPCVNPHHLALGTYRDNNRDTVAKGRHKSSGLIGAQVWAAKLTEDQVREIRGLRGMFTQRHLAARFGVDHSVIGRIQRGQGWKHVS